MAECLVECDSSSPHQVIPLLSFLSEDQTRKNPDLKLVYKVTPINQSTTSS